MKLKKSILWISGIVIAAIIIISIFYSVDNHVSEAENILDKTGVKGGLIIHAGTTNGKLTTALHVNGRYIVQGLAQDDNMVKKARKYIKKKGLYGKVTVDHWNGKKLPYADNMVNLFVACGSDLGEINSEEINRVLSPKGVAYIRENGKWDKWIKPWPDDIDEWTHYMYNSQGDFRSKDKKTGLPMGIQWDGGPKWARHHDHTASMHAMVSANGRNFSVIDEGPIESIQFPSKYTLTARDAFNGIVLWKRELQNWYNHLYPLKSGPGWMPRRLVAVGNEVCFSPGIGQDMLKLDAATGEVIHEYNNTSTTVELIVSEGKIFANVDSDKKFPDYNQQDPNCWVERDRESQIWSWEKDKNKSYLKVFDSESNKLIWEKETNITPMTLVADDKTVCFHDGENMLSLDTETGNERWSTNVYEMNMVRTGYSGPRVILKDKYVVFAPKDKLFVLSKENGEVLWSEDEKPVSGHFSLEDVYSVSDKIWVMGRGNHGEFTTYDLKNGNKAEEISNPIESFYIHQRCYPGRSTDNFLLPPMMGTTAYNIDKKEWSIDHWVRGGCIYGMMPANGFIYTPPHACACYYQSSITGFAALTSDDRNPEDINITERLQKGPAYGKVENEKKYELSSWPVYRHDNERSGYVKSRVPINISPAWEIKIDDNLSQPTVAGGRIFISATNRHTIYAFDTGSGKELWQYTAGGRVDSPPTIYKGMAVFGCRDGNIYALRAKDGEMVWKYLAAPDNKKIVSYGQLESIWPVSGSVLIQNDKLYCIAGRNMFLDGGLKMLIIDPLTGELVNETIMDRTVSEPGKKDLQDFIMGKHMPVANADILSSDGSYIYMKSQTYDMNGRRVRIKPQRPDTQYGDEVHLFAPTGFLDKNWHQRTYWLYGRAAGEGWAEFQLPPKRVPYGRIISIDENNAYSYGRLPELLANTSISEYRLFSAAKKPARRVGIPRMEGDWSEADYYEGWNPEINKRGKTYITTMEVNDPLPPHTVDWKALDALPGKKLTALKYNWEMMQPEILVRAMVLADDKLFVAGPKDVFDEKKMWGHSNEQIFKEKINEQLKWINGEHGSFIWVVSKNDGKILHQYKIDYMPAHDGLIAANERLYLVTESGELICYE